MHFPHFDIERIAPRLPGATLDPVAGDTFAVG